MIISGADSKVTDLFQSFWLRLARAPTLRRHRLLPVALNAKIALCLGEITMATITSHMLVSEHTERSQEDERLRERSRLRPAPCISVSVCFYNGKYNKVGKKAA